MTEAASSYVWLRPTRWVAAGLLLGVIIVVTWLSSAGDQFLVCPGGPEQTCRPLTFSDPPLVISLVFAALLLLPDMSRIRVAGLIDIERAIAHTEGELKATRSELGDLRQQISAVLNAQAAAQAAASVSSTQHVHLLHPGQAAGVDEATIQAKREAVDDY